MKPERLRQLAEDLRSTAFTCERAAAGGVDVIEAVRALRGTNRKVMLELALLEPEVLGQEQPGRQYLASRWET